jgi:transcriptional regulator of aromatic amino acid metabolism
MEKRVGRFEAADTGTLFLDEIGEISASTQVKLLRFLETKSIERVGGSKPIALDVRLVAATNRDLEKMVREGKFREDLFFRLNVVRVTLPPVAVADCAGHFAGLPAMPVAILGRAALGLVRAADPAVVLGVAEVEALRFAWAGAVITLAATPSAEGWRVEGSVDGSAIARWSLRPRG